ncbi:MAG: hypothetical protein R2755_29175 [Acidimicrobiales bacterium]
MACSHRADCPLFPNLNSSLSGWRTHYCDTEEAWLNCARYTRSLAGKPVPVALLPNGKMAQILEPGASATPAARRAASSGNKAVAGGRTGSVLLADRPAEQAPRRSWFARLFGLRFAR